MSRRFLNLTPFTTRPFFTSRQGMMRLAAIRLLLRWAARAHRGSSRDDGPLQSALPLMAPTTPGSVASGLKSARSFTPPEACTRKPCGPPRRQLRGRAFQVPSRPTSVTSARSKPRLQQGLEHVVEPALAACQPRVTMSPPFMSRAGTMRSPGKPRRAEGCSTARVPTTASKPRARHLLARPRGPAGRRPSGSAPPGQRAGKAGKARWRASPKAPSRSTRWMRRAPAATGARPSPRASSRSR